MNKLTEEDLCKFVKRDMDLVREILIWAEQGGLPSRRPDAHNIKLAYHCKIMEEAGLINAAIADAPVMPGVTLPYKVHVSSLTWKGHEFLEAFREDTIWKKVRTTFAKQGIPLTYEFLWPFIRGWMKKQGIEIE